MIHNVNAALTVETCSSFSGRKEVVKRASDAAYPRGFKNPISKVFGRNNHTLNGFWDQGS